MTEFRMPSLGADMTEGTVVEWLVAPGDHITRGDVIAVVDTDKAAIDVECFQTGTVDDLLVAPGQKVAVGTPLALITVELDTPTPTAGTEDTARTAPFPTRPEPPPLQPQPSPLLPEPPPLLPEPTPRRPTPPPPSPPPMTPTRPAPLNRPALGGPADQPRIRSPLTRKRATEAGLDLTTVTGSGPHGEITRTDVERARHSSVSARVRISPYARHLAVERGIDLRTLTGSGVDGVIRARDLPVPSGAPGSTSTRSRSATAALMARSKQEIPHYYLAHDIDLDPALEWLRAHNRAIPVEARVLPAALLLRAVALSARSVPELNGHWMHDQLRPSVAVHVGVAVSLRDGGLIVPVLHDAEELPLDALMSSLRSAADRARGGRLRSSEVTGATITVTNLGELGTDLVHGVIHPPQVALVGFGAIRPRPWASGDQVTTRHVVTATLAADHRATDAATGARFLRDLSRRLHHPQEL